MRLSALIVSICFLRLTYLRSGIFSQPLQGYQGSLANYIKTFKMKYSYYGVTWFDYKD